jgi:hypothetical protein
MCLRSLSAMVGVGCVVKWWFQWSLVVCVAGGLMGDVWWVDVWCLVVGDVAVHSEATLDRPEAMTLEAVGSFRGRASRNIHMLPQ